MTNNRYSITIILLTLSLQVFSQSIQRGTDFSSAAHYGTTTNLQVQSNIGELIVNTIGTQTLLTQGFVQPEPPVVTSSNNYNTTFEGVAYPNPVTNNLYVDLNCDSNNDITIEVFDILGNLQIIDIVKTTFLGKSHFEFNCKNLDSGVYFVRINSQKNQLNKTFKINKV